MGSFVRVLLIFCCVSFVSICLNGCTGGSGGDAWRYDPGIPGQVTGVTAESGDKLVTLSWQPNSIATSYNVYYVSELNGAAVTKANGTKLNVEGISKVIDGLDNKIKYHFIVTALNRDGESVDSIQVSATPGPTSNASLLGSPLLDSDDIIDISSLTNKLLNDSNPSTMPVSQWIWEMLDNESKELLVDPNATSTQLRTTLVQALNRILQGDSFYDQTRFAGITLRYVTRSLVAEEPTGDDQIHFNRLLLEDVYPQEIARQMGTWYFHTLVTGPDARWERGTMTVTMTDEGGCNALISDFEDSSGNTQPPSGFGISARGDAVVRQSGDDAWPYFHGAMGARKNMIAAAWSPSLTSRAITIFQKKRETDDYTIDDVSGTGSGQNPDNPYLQGNGPTRFAYHLLRSGASTEWEYSNCKIGRQGQFWLDQYKDITYWGYSTPSYSVAPGYDYLWKVTSIGVDPDGLVKEYSNYAAVRDGVQNVVFTGRMSADKTLIIGVSTRADGNGSNKQYFLRTMQLCFIPVDQSLPEPSLNDLAGEYKFHKLGAVTDSNGNITASWAYGLMSITGSGVTTFPAYADSNSANSSSDTFTLSYFPDPGSSGKFYRDFANFTTPVQSGSAHYYDGNGNPYYTYYDYWSYGRTDSPLALPINPNYYNEHGSLSYNKDLFVMTRTDASGYCMIIGLK